MPESDLLQVRLEVQSSFDYFLQTLCDIAEIHRVSASTMIDIVEEECGSSIVEPFEEWLGI